MSYLIDLRKRKKEENAQNVNIKTQANYVAKGAVKNNPLPPIPDIQEKPTDKEISWTASDHETSNKKSVWIVVFVFVAGAVVVQYLFKDLILSILLLTIAFALIASSKKRKTESRVSITSAGMSINDNKYYYRDLKSFWIEYQPGTIKELSVETKKVYMPYIKIPLSDTDPVSLRELLVKNIPEKEHPVSLIEQVFKKIGLF